MNGQIIHIRSDLHPNKVMVTLDMNELTASTVKFGVDMKYLFDIVIKANVVLTVLLSV